MLTIMLFMLTYTTRKDLLFGSHVEKAIVYTDFKFMLQRQRYSVVWCSVVWCGVMWCGVWCS